MSLRKVLCQSTNCVHQLRKTARCSVQACSQLHTASLTGHGCARGSVQAYRRLHPTGITKNVSAFNSVQACRRLHAASVTEQAGVWSSVQPDLVLPDDVDFARHMINYMGRHGDKISMVDGVSGETLTFAELQTQTVRLASALARAGVLPGDVVTLMLPNCVQYPAVFIAVTAIGATASPLNPVYTAGELNKVMTLSGTRFIFTSPELLPVVTQATEGLPKTPTVFTVGSAPGHRPYSDLVADDGSAFPEQLDIRSRDYMASLPYSSGTTGMPKGVMLSNYNLVANIEQMTHHAVADLLSTTGSCIGVLPFFHIYGLVVILFCHIKRGASITSMPRFTPEVFLDCIQKAKADFLHLAPPLVLFLAKHPLVEKYDISTVKKIMSAAAPVGLEVCHEVMARLPHARVGQGYGMTESSPVTHVCPDDIHNPKLSSIGQVVPQTDSKVIDINTGETVGAFQEGEICSRGPQIMMGYYNNPEATAQTVDKDGWLHSGDIGYVDEEGYFYVTDRLKELIKVKGFQVAPAELEALLVTHPAITDAAVIGVPDERAGELPRAFVVKRPQVECSESDVCKFIEERVAPFKQLAGGVEFIDEVPKTASGKILRRNLKGK